MGFGHGIFRSTASYSRDGISQAAAIAVGDDEVGGA